MSKVSKDRKYLNLENVRIAYQPGDDSIQITSTDKDLNNKPFKISLSKGTDAELIIRNLLHEKGLIRKEPARYGLIPEKAYGKLDSRTPWGEVPLGIGSSAEINWNVNANSNLLIAGSTNSGKTATAKSIIHHCLTHNNNWEVYIHDPSANEYDRYSKYSKTVRRISNTEDELFHIVNNLESELKSRYALMSAANANNAQDLPNRPKAIMLILDDFFGFKASGDKTVKETYERFLNREIVQSLKKILQLGRAANIHLAFVNHNVNYLEELGMLRSLNTRVVLGKVREDYSKILLGDNQAENTPYLKGRGFVNTNGEIEGIQCYWSSESSVADWILNFGKRNEPELYKKLLIEQAIED